MSLLIVEILPQGVVFAADRFVTVTTVGVGANRGLCYRGQDSGCKILKWPHGRALVGAVGNCSIDGGSLYDWLYDFIGDHVNFKRPDDVAYDLRDRLQRTLGRLDPPDGTIVEFATFAEHAGITVPEMWHITNIHGINAITGEYDPPTDTFLASEEILGHHLNQIPPAELRALLERRAAIYDPYWFHQTIDLAVFNTLEQGVKAAFKLLHEAGRLIHPQTLEDWEKHARMWVLMFGAYFEAFGQPGERYVGGGADALSIPWPD